MRFIALLAALMISIAPVVAADAGKTYGKGVGGADVIKVSELVAHPDTYVGKTVRVEGVVEDVCPKAGCWMDIVSDGGKVRVKVDDGVIVFPMDAKGKHAVAEGVFTMVELTPDQAIAHAKHEAEEKGQTADAAKLKDAPRIIYRIAGTGAVIK